MKNTKRARRRAANIQRINKTINWIYAVNTAHTTKDESRQAFLKRIHCETTGRRLGDWKKARQYKLDDIAQREQRQGE